MAEIELWKRILESNQSNLEFFPAGTYQTPPQPGDQWEIPNFLKAIDAPWAKVLISVYENPMSFPGSLSPCMGNLVRAIVMNIAPKTVLEIGSFIGVSTLWIASAMAEYQNIDKLYCMDIFPDHTHNPWCPGVTLLDPLNFILDNLKNCGLNSFVEFLKGDSKELIWEVTRKAKRNFDFVFIDGDHTREGCLTDFLNIEPFVATGGYILFHDVFPIYCGVDGPAFTLIDKILPSKKYELCQIYTNPLNFGFALVRKLA